MAAARAGLTPCDLFTESNAWQVRVREGGQISLAQSILIRFADGRGIALGVLPGLIGTIVVETGRVLTVNYTPSRHTERYGIYEAVSNELEKRRAFAAVASRNGLFRIERGEETEMAEVLREFKSIDPTLGLYACYAYAQAGEFGEIESVYDYMSQEPEPIPFDVALLANRLRRPGMTGLHSTAPFCPMLTQGWALLESFGTLLPQPVAEAGKHLVPGLWTTFTSEGMDILWSAMERGEIK